MDSFYKVMSNMAELDRMRAAAENMEARGDKMAPMVMKFCDVGDEVCRSYVKLYNCIGYNSELFGSTKIRQQYEEEIKPLEEKRDSLARLLNEQCANFFVAAK